MAAIGAPGCIGFTPTPMHDPPVWFRRTPKSAESWPRGCLFGADLGRLGETAVPCKGLHW
ncbi:hypothetical protein GCM10010530_30600 [Kribbella aluminosa]